MPGDCRGLQVNLFIWGGPCLDTARALTVALQSEVIQ